MPYRRVRNYLTTTKAALMGLKTHGRATKGKAKLLSDEIIQRVGRDWLCTVHPALAEKVLGETMVQVDGMLNSRSIYAIPGYILAFATLYDSTDDALNAMQSKPNQKSSDQAKHEDVSSDDLFEAYVQARGSYKRISVGIGRPPHVYVLFISTRETRPVLYGWDRY